MTRTLVPLNQKFIAVSCESTYTGAITWTLTDCEDKRKMYNLCRKFKKELKENLNTEIEFSRFTLKELIKDMEESCFLEEIREGSHDNFEDVNPNIITPDELMKSDNLPLLYRVLELYFNTDYENELLENYFSAQGVNVLLAT